METTSISLLDALRRQPDEGAWRRLVHLYTPLLLLWAKRAGCQSNDAADLTQDVFTVLLEKLRTFEYDVGGSFRAWLKTVTMNRLRDLNRRKKLRLALPLDGVNEVDADNPLVTFWEREYQQVLLRNALDMIRGEFPESVWGVGTDFLLGERSAREVAAAHGVSENAVYIAKCRVQRRLREVVAGLME